MMKWVGVAALLLAFSVFWFAGCASSGRQEVMVEQTDTSSGPNSSPVPGEHIPDDGRVTPGAAGSNASIHW